MNARGAFLLACGLVVVVANGACRSQDGESHAPPIPAPDSPAAAIFARAGPAATSPLPDLPEDAEAGARSVAEWHEHLEREERERRLHYDRRKLPQHRELMKTLRAVRQSYDSAASEGAVRAAQQKQMALRPELEKSLDAIDHWRVNSKVLPEYKDLIGIFSDAYPRARIEALSGEKDPLATLQKGVATRFATIDEWLREAAEGEDE